MIHPARSIALTFLAAFLALPFAPRAGAKQPDAGAVREVIRAQVESIGGGHTVRIAGEELTPWTPLPALYQKGDYSAQWTKPAAIDDLLVAIRASAEDGLEPDDFHLAAIERLRKENGTDAGSVADLDLLLSDALARLAYQMRFGKVDPSRLDPDWNVTVRVRGVDAITWMQETIAGLRIREAVRKIGPQHPFYGKVKGGLADYRRIAAAGGWPSIPEGPTIKPGMTDPRIPVIRRRLAVTGDLPNAPAAGETTDYDPALQAAVRAFQDRHLLDADGAIGSATLSALNVPVEDRIDQLRGTLERCRWVMRDLPDRFVLVNVAGFRIYFLEKGELVWKSNVVVGKPYTKTPIFRADMKTVVLNPTWTVPASIVRNEIEPGMRRDPRYLARKGIRRAGDKYVQPAGPDNALGRIKYLFPNSHNVYLHDTPSKSLFEKTSRSFSHGCVRVQHPTELAPYVLDDPAWTLASVDAAVDTGKTRTLTLKKPIPVLILYWTASVGLDNRVYFRPDVYGRDPALIRGLKAPFTPGKHIEAELGEE
jgi:murein L,D-transpeptidase YcbB/YkuD